MKSLGKIGFVDESGAHGFNISNKNTHFVMTVIILNQDKRKEVESKFLQIKSSLNLNGELKSSKIANNEDRRLKILGQIESLDFTFYSLVIDKRELNKESGLRWKPSFYKFLYGIVYNNIYRTYRDIEIRADAMIDSEFTTGFKKYIQKNHQTDLFNQNNFTFSDSKTDQLLQLADLIGGTLNRFYCGKSTIDLRDVLKDKVVAINHWPEKYQPYTMDMEEVNDEHRDTIIDLAKLRVENYLNRHGDATDVIIKRRTSFLEYLYHEFVYHHINKYVSTWEIMEHLNHSEKEKLSENYLKLQIVGPLRDEGIIIVSTKAGYKLPCCQKDLFDFFNHYNSYIQPMVSRARKCYEAILMATGNELDMLDHPAYATLKKLIQ